LSENEEIIKVIEKFFDVGKNKNLIPLREIQLNDSRFSSFSDVPPFDLKDFATTLVLEELRFVSISDYDYHQTLLFDHMNPIITTSDLSIVLLVDFLL